MNIESTDKEKEKLLAIWIAWQFKPLRKHNWPIFFLNIDKILRDKKWRFHHQVFGLLTIHLRNLHFPFSLLTPTLRSVGAIRSVFCLGGTHRSYCAKQVKIRLFHFPVRRFLTFITRMVVWSFVFPFSLSFFRFVRAITVTNYFN